MNDFYDLNDFFAFALRKIKICIAVIILSIIGFAGMRFYNIYQEYTAANVKSDSIEKEQITGDEPIWKRAQITLCINVLNAEESGTRAMDIASAISSAAYNEEVFDQLIEKYYEISAEKYEKDIELLYEYGYILDKERSYKFSIYDFQNAFRTEAVNGSVTISFMSMDEEYSKEVAGVYAELLITKAAQSISGFSYDTISEGVYYQLPTPSAGAISTRYKSSAAGSNGMAFTTVIKQTIKGMVWGGILGLVLAAIIIFLMYMMSQKILVLSHLRNRELHIYGTVPIKKQGTIKRILRRWIGMLEGNQAVFNDVEEVADLIVNDISSEAGNNIVVTGTVGDDLALALVKNINLNKKSAEQEFSFCDSINFSGSGLKEIKEAKSVILIETIGQSYKNEIDKEIKKISEQAIPILGIVVAE